MKILIIDTDSYDKAIFSTVLVENLKSHYTTASIDFLVQEKTKEILKSNSDINNIIVADKIGLNHEKTFKKLKASFLLGMKIRKNRYDIIFTNSSEDDTAFATAMSGAKTRVGMEPTGRTIKKLKPYTDTYEESYLKHIVEKKLDIMRVLGLKVSVKKPVLCPSIQASRKIEAILSRYKIESFVHLHFCSSSDDRCIDNALAARVIDFLESEKKINTVVTSLMGDAQSIRTLGILSLAKSRPLSLIGSLDLDEMAALSARSIMFVGVQSEVLYISCMQNTPSVAIFSENDAYENGSWDGNVYDSGYDEQGGKQSMGIHTVFQGGSKDLISDGDGKISIDDMNFKNIIAEIESKLLHTNS